MKSIMLLVVLLGTMSMTVVSCGSAKVKEKLSDKVSSAASKVLVAELECENSALVYSDIKERVDKLFKIESNGSELKSSSSSVKSVGSKSLICRAITGALMPIVFDLAKSGKLAEWECKVEKGEAYIMTQVYRGCDKISNLSTSEPNSLALIYRKRYYLVIEKPPRQLSVIHLTS